MKQLVLMIFISLLFQSTAEARGKRTKNKQEKNIRSKKKTKRIAKKPPGQWAVTWGTGIPNPIDLGIAYIKEKQESHMISLGQFNVPIGKNGRINNLRLEKSHLEYRYRNEPWTEHPVFMETGLGVQRLKFKGEQNADIENGGTSVSIPVKSSINITSYYYHIHFGMIFYHGDHFSHSFGFGYQVPVHSEAQIEAEITGDAFIDDIIRSTSSYKALEEEFEDLGVRFGKLGLPYLQLIEIAYRF